MPGSFENKDVWPLARRDREQGFGRSSVKQYRNVPVKAAIGGCIMLASLMAVPAQSQQLTNASYQTNINLNVLPVAQLDILGSGLLYLEIPPSGSTIPSSGVRFVVSGNASASVSAEPDDFINIVGEGAMGKAVLDGEAVGYKIELRFPRVGVVGSPSRTAPLPGYEGPAGPLAVNLMSTGGQREGEIHMEAHPNWTPTGGIPLPGVYVGEVLLTLTADY